MSYIGSEPTSVAFLTDTFSGNGSTTAFTMQVAPATTSSVLVAITGVVQDPSTYSVIGTTLTFSAAPPTGTNNISVRYLGIPASGVTTTAYRTVTDFTATASQTTFSVPSYTVGYIDVFRNGVRLAAADYTATNGTTVVLANACTVGDVVTTESFYVSSVLNAIPAVAGAVNTSYIANGAVGNTQLAAGAARANFGAGAILQVVNVNISTDASTASTTYVDSSFSATITPSSSSSRILIIGNFITGNSTSAGAYIQMRRGTSTAISTTGGQLQNGDASAAPITMVCVDSPATTSATTYKFYYKTNNGTFYIHTYGSNSNGSITLMEIAG